MKTKRKAALEDNMHTALYGKAHGLKRRSHPRPALIYSPVTHFSPLSQGRGRGTGAKRHTLADKSARGAVV